VLRRTFFKWIGSAALPFALPRWARAQAGPFTEQRAATLSALAGGVLPGSLGPRGIESAAAQFTQWVRGYKAGAEMSAGYGFTRLQVVPADPSRNYGAQLDQLESAARAKGAASFSKLDIPARRAIVQAAIEAANVDGIPRRPNGKHVAADLMGFFFFISSDGHDFLYNAAIKRDECRGLASSGDRPAPVR
jgi:hypothetical protein